LVLYGRDDRARRRQAKHPADKYLSGDPVPSSALSHCHGDRSRDQPNDSAGNVKDQQG
jgi:hypothetical protein